MSTGVNNVVTSTPLTVPSNVAFPSTVKLPDACTTFGFGYVPPRSPPAGPVGAVLPAAG